MRFPFHPAVRVRAVVMIVTALASTVFAQRPTKPPGLTHYFIGSAVDSAAVPVGGPAVLLMGGGSEVDQAFITRAYPILNGGDIVVIRASGSNGYQSYFYSNLAVPAALMPNSVETLIIDSRAKADLAYVRYALEHAEMIWLAGGDQSDYLSYWRGTAVDTALRAVYRRGAIIGGTSAGAQVMGEYIYDPLNVSAVTSAQAVANPYHGSVILSTDFLGYPPLFDTIVDAHFANRDRMGRLLAFMARLRQDARTSRITGIGLDEGTSLFVDAAGVGFMQRQRNSGSVYILREDRLDTDRSQVAPGRPLIYSRLSRTRLEPGQTFDFSSGTTNAASTLIDLNGSLPASPY